MESSKNKSMALWVGLAAAAAGITAVAVISKWRERSLSNLASSKSLRGVQDVLADCYNKIKEIEEHIPEIVTQKPARRVNVRTKSNGNPVLES